MWEPNLFFPTVTIRSHSPQKETTHMTSALTGGVDEDKQREEATPKTEEKKGEEEDEEEAPHCVF